MIEGPNKEIQQDRKMESSKEELNELILHQETITQLKQIKHHHIIHRKHGSTSSSQGRKETIQRIFP